MQVHKNIIKILSSIIKRTTMRPATNDGIFFPFFYETMFTEESAFFSDGLFITKLVGQLASGKFREAAFSFCGGL